MNTVDVLGIGLGPFNLSLAALLDGHELDCLFVDKKLQFDWHAGIMLDWTTLQVPFLADLVTMVNPTSRYSFLNYLHEHNRLYKFFFKEEFLIPRKEYNHYCQWVAGLCESCQFGQNVTQLHYEADSNNSYWLVELQSESGEKSQVKAKNIVLGTGSVPSLPACLNQAMANGLKNIIHSADFIENKSQVLNQKHITVLGSGQSAAEVVLELLHHKNSEQTIYWLTKGRGFFPMEYSKLGLEHFSPDYIDYFYNLSGDTKDSVLPTQDLLYKGISAKTIADIYDLLYQQTIAGEKNNVKLLAHSKLIDVETTINNTLICKFEHLEQNKHFQFKTDCIVAGTGYNHAQPDFIQSLEHVIAWDNKKRYQIDRNYQIKTNLVDNQCKLFIQNGEMHTHGIGAPDLTLGAYRSAQIANQLLNKPVYKIHQKNTFLQFGVGETL